MISTTVTQTRPVIQGLVFHPLGTSGKSSAAAVANPEDFNKVFEPSILVQTPAGNGNRTFVVPNIAPYVKNPPHALVFSEATAGLYFAHQMDPEEQAVIGLNISPQLAIMPNEAFDGKIQSILNPHLHVFSMPPGWKQMQGNSSLSNFDDVRYVRARAAMYLLDHFAARGLTQEKLVSSIGFDLEVDESRAGVKVTFDLPLLELTQDPNFFLQIFKPFHQQLVEANRLLDEALVDTVSQPQFLHSHAYDLIKRMQNGELIDSELKDLLKTPQFRSLQEAQANLPLGRDLIEALYPFAERRNSRAQELVSNGGGADLNASCRTYRRGGAAAIILTEEKDCAVMHLMLAPLNYPGGCLEIFAPGVQGVPSKEAVDYYSEGNQQAIGAFGGLTQQLMTSSGFTKGQLGQELTCFPV
jgi:hypothetical protein